MFAQQPIDAWHVMCIKPFTTSIMMRLQLTDLEFHFLVLGYNDLNIPLFDKETDGCNDGIEAMNINRNQGAESTLAYLLSHIISRPYFE